MLLTPRCKVLKRGSLWNWNTLNSSFFSSFLCDYRTLTRTFFVTISPSVSFFLTKLNWELCKISIIFGRCTKKEKFVAIKSNSTARGGSKAEASCHTHMAQRNSYLLSYIQCNGVGKGKKSGLFLPSLISSWQKKFSWFMFFPAWSVWEHFPHKTWKKAF